MYAQLGSIVFEGLFSFTELEQETETTYVEIPLINGKPDLQPTGLALNTINVKMRLHKAFCDPGIRYDQIEMHQINREILPFLDGRGNLLGNFVIQKVKQVYVQTDSLGAVTCSDCELVLKEYVSPDRIASRALAAQAAATAVGEPTGAVAQVEMLSVSPQADMFISISDSQLDALTTANAVTKPAPSTSDVNAGLSGLQKLGQSVTETREKISRYETYVSVGAALWATLKSTLDSVESISSQLTTALLNGDVANYKILAEQLLQLTGSLTTGGLPLLRTILLRS